MASISKRTVGGQARYDVNYREPDGRKRRKTFTKKQAADDFKVTVEADKLRGAYIDRDAGRVTFRQYAETWLAAQTFEATTREQVVMLLGRHIYPVAARRWRRSSPPRSRRGCRGSPSTPRPTAGWSSRTSRRS